MKIVDVTEFWSERGGGVRAYLTQLLREGTTRGHEVVVVAPGARDEAVPLEGGRVLRVRGPAMPYDPSYHALWNVRAITDLIDRERPDIVEASSPYVAALVATRVRQVRVRSLVVHSDFIDTYARPVLQGAFGPRIADVALSPPWAMLRAATARFDVTVCSGRWLADKLEAHGCARVSCVPFGIRHAEFSPSLRDETLRASLLGALAAQPDATLVAVVGRLAVEKRVPLVFRAMAELRRTRPLAIVVLGDGPERPRLEALARELNLPVRFEGFVTDRPRFAKTLASADVLVHGCACETFGFSVAEALASGVPVVVPDAGGAREFADEGAAERYEPLGDAVAVSVATARLLRRPRAPMVAAAVAAAARVPPAESHFGALFARYESLLAEGPR